MRTQEEPLFKRQLLRFLLVGSTTVLIDFLVYTILINILPIPASKIVSFLSGTVFAYFANKLWTFEKVGISHKELVSFFILYGITLFINVSINQAVLHFLPDAILIAFLAATGTSTVLNFIGQKWWVFRLSHTDHN